MRNWSIEIFLVNEHDGSMMPANVYDKATYKLHPSFGPKETQGEHGVRLSLLSQWASLAEDPVKIARGCS